MAGRIMELAIAIKGKLDGSVTSSMQRAIQESRQLQTQIRQANQAMRDAQRAADAEQRATGRVSTAQYQHIAELQARINALTQRRSDILDAQARKEQAGAKFSGAAGRLGAGIAMTAAAAAPLTAMIGTAANFEQAMSKVKAITNSSNEDMERLTATAQELGSKTQFSASQAAEAMSYLGMAGWKTEQIISGMPGLLDLAAASGSSLATVADIVSDDLTAFGMSADQAGHMADVMAAASTNANTNVEMMGQTFKYAGAVAGALGYDLEDVAVATGLMANAGIKADQAGTSLRSIMTRLAAPTKESGNAMDQLGISVVNADGTMKPFMQTMEEMRDAFDGLSEAEKAEKAKMLAGQEAMSGLLAIVNASDEDFAKLANAITNSDGAAAQMAKTMNDNAKGGAIQLQSAIEGVSIAIGQIFLPTLARIAGALASAVGGIANWAKENQGLVTAAIAAAGAITGLILAVLAINTAVKGFEYLNASMNLYKTMVQGSTIATQLWSAATKVATTAQAALNAVMAGNPLALAVLAVMALVAAMVYLFNTNKEFHDVVIAAWEDIKAAAAEVWEAIAPIVMAAWEGIKSAAQAGIEFLKGIWASIAPSVMAGVSMIVPIFSGIVNVVKTIIATGFRLWAAYIRTWVSVVGTIIQTVVSVVVAVWGAISNAVKTTIAVITAVVNALVPVFSAVWSIIKTVAKVAFIAIAVVALPILATIAAAMLAAGAVIYVTWLGIKAVAMAVWGFIGPYVMAVVDAVVSFLVSAGEVIMGVWETIKTYATEAWAAITAIVSGAAEFIGAFITAAAAVIIACWNSIYNAAVSAWNSIVSTVQSVWSTIQNVVDSGVAAVTEKWERLKSIFSSPIQAVVNFVKGGDSDAASKSGVDVSANAAGGIYNKGAFLTTFAEKSAEAAIPLDGSARALSLWQQAGQMMGAMPSGAATSRSVAMPVSNKKEVRLEYNPTITINGGGGADTEQMVKAALREQYEQFMANLPRMLDGLDANKKRLSMV